jgi:flagellar hook-associated protein 2
MANISSLGVGSNLDLSGLLDQLSQAENAPVLALQRQQTSYNTKLTAYARLQGALGTLQTAAAKLADATLFQGAKVGSSATDVLSATGSATAVPGTYTANVTQVAQAQSLVAAGQASATTAVGGGTLTISWGTISGGTLDATTGKYAGAAFAADAGRTPVGISIPAGSTLEGVRDAINAKTDAGLTATIVNDGSASPSRLVLTSTRTGANASLKIDATGDAALQDLLGQDPAGTQKLQQTSAAQDAKLTVNGIAVTSASNAVAEAVQGVTMNVGKVGSSTLTVQKDTASVANAVSSFVSAYNALQSLQSQLTAYDADAKSGAPLLGDATLRMVQTRIRGVLNTPQAGALQTLSSIGVAFQKDGTLQTDSGKLQKALNENLSGVADLFATSTSGGLGKQLSALVDGFSSTGGVLEAATTGVKSSIKRLGDDITAAQDRVDATIARYRKQFNQLDVMMSQMTSTSSYLTQQFASMSASTK